MQGKFIYPSFIDLYTDYGMPEATKPKRSESPQLESNIKGAYGWNQAIHTDFHGVMGNDYIMRAVDIIESKIENPTYFIFSDDVEWCKENIHLKNMKIVDHSYAGEKFNYYLQLMISCKHFIIPNSSFAWWSAWLNTNSDKIVIAPKNWFNVDIDTSDLIPDNWIRI
jgi:hypothetical protein